MLKQQGGGGNNREEVLKKMAAGFDNYMDLSAHLQVSDAPTSAGRRVIL